MTETDITQLIELLQRHISLCNHLNDLRPRQAALVDAGYSEDLLAFLAQRQQVIEQLDTVCQSLAPFRGEWDQLWGGLDQVKRDHVGPLVQRSKRMLAEIVESDDRDRHRLQEAQDRIGADLSQVRQVGAARRAYGLNPSPPSSRFTNQQG